MSAKELCSFLMQMLSNVYPYEDILIQQAVIPFVNLLGYNQSQTYVGADIGFRTKQLAQKRYRADVIIASSLTSQPWILIETKSHRPSSPDTMLQQLQKYSAIVNPKYSVGFSPEILFILYGEEERKYNLRRLTLREAGEIFTFLKNPGTLDKINDSIEELGADGHLAGVEADVEEHLEPFDPEQISIDTKPLIVESVVRRMIQGSIRLAPPFQRKTIWDLERKSRLIESLMLKIPIPMFYVAADRKNNWDVVDGLQRLTTIREFILGEEYMRTRNETVRGIGFRLEKLEFWGKKYDGCTFKELPQFLVNRILEAEFKFTIINPGTPEEVKRNIFKRINTGGMPLTAQEIRHALYLGKSTKLLKDLVETDIFKVATGNSANDSRMAARGLVLRFLAFSIRNYEYYSDMDKFLSNTMRIINVMPDPSWSSLQNIFKDQEIPPLRFTDVKVLEDRFQVGMTRSFRIFGQHAFRKSWQGRRAPINKALFEAWGNLLADLEKEEFEYLYRRRDEFLIAYYDLLSVPGFYSRLSRDSSKYFAIKLKYQEFRNLVRKYT